LDGARDLDADRRQKLTALERELASLQANAEQERHKWQEQLTTMEKKLHAEPSSNEGEMANLRRQVQSMQQILHSMGVYIY